jgi:hypothetical protein
LGNNLLSKRFTAKYKQFRLGDRRNMAFLNMESFRISRGFAGIEGKWPSITADMWDKRNVSSQYNC